MPNRLSGSTSPYLLQHQNNPVDWYPWGPEAFERARAEDKPIFLSVGYSSCHWCHVMEHESFEDGEVAEALNGGFVSVKVDREERPDVDEAYMTAVQLASGRGGWPMSVFMTPDRKPFLAGTYFPKEDRGGHPGFLTLVRNIANIWQTRRQELEDAAAEFAKSLTEVLAKPPPQTFTTLSPKFLHDAVRTLAQDFDQKNAGFGGAPKFPPHSGIDFLLNYVTWEDGEQQMKELAAAMALVTLEKMCLGGIHDHVGGGFHRYSTDEEWLLPHFEKMLYDNALMLANLSKAVRIALELDERLAALFARSAERLVGWLEREMTSPEGLMYSALDADTEGEEGKFYVWTADEIRQALGERAADFIETYGINEEGNFLDEATGERTGTNIPHVDADEGDAFEWELNVLREAREKRVKPGLDDKAIIAWNGLAILALAKAGEEAMAEAIAEAILKAEHQHGGLPHQITNGTPSGAGFLDDYAFFCLGLLRLAESIDASGAPHVDTASPWFGSAQRLGRQMVELFYDEQKGGFFGTSERHEELFGRTKPFFDHPIPSGNAAAARVLIRLGDLERAKATLATAMGWMERAPGSTEGLLLAGLELLRAVGEPAAEIAAPQHDQEIGVMLAQRELVATADGWAKGEVVLDIPAGLHVNTDDPPARWLTPTLLEFDGVEARVDYPAGEDHAYTGRTVIPFRVRSSQPSAEFELKVRYQPCTDTECLLAKEQAFDCRVSTPAEAR